MYNNRVAIMLLLFSIITSGIAQGIIIIAIPWYFTETLQQNSLFTAWYAILTLFGLFWGLYSGVLIDRTNRKKILISINFINAIFFTCLWGIFHFTQYNHPLIFFSSFGVCSLYYIIFFPNLYALLQELVEPKNYVKINSIIEIQSQLINITAALSCGILLSGSNKFFSYFKLNVNILEAWSIQDIFWLNAILYIVTIILLIPIKYFKKHNNQLPVLQESWNDLKVAFYFLKKKKSVLIYGVCSQVIFAFLIVELFTLLPLFVQKCLKETIVIFSLADVTYGLGAIIAGMITILLLKFIKKIDLTILLIIITGFAILLMINLHEITIFFIASLLIGITNASARVTRMSYFFDTIPNHLIGRTNTIFNAINTLIRSGLILLFSITWFSYDDNVIMGYRIGIYLLIIFVIPLILLQLKKHNFKL